MTVIMEVTLALMSQVDPQSLTLINGVIKMTKSGIKYIVLNETPEPPTK